MHDQVEELADGPAQEPRRNRGWFTRSDQRINLEGRPRGSKKAVPECPQADCAKRADRVKLLFVTERDLASHLSGLTVPCVANLPEDYRIIESRFDAGRNGSVLTIRSGSFPRIARAAPIPEFEPERPGADFARRADRVQILFVPEKVLAGRLTGVKTGCVVNLPPGFQVVDGRFDVARNGLVLTIRSDRFPRIARGAPIQDFAARFFGTPWSK